MAYAKATYLDKSQSIIVQHWNDGEVSAEPYGDECRRDSVLRDLCARVNNYGHGGNTLEDARAILEDAGYELIDIFTNTITED